MTLADLLAVTGATMGGFFALLSLAFAKAPGWAELRWFALVAATAGGFSACTVAMMWAHGEPATLAFAHCAVSLAAVNVYAWMRYSAQRRGTFERSLEALALVLAALALVPGTLLSDEVLRHGDGLTGGRYVDVLPTLPGLLALGLLLASAAVPFGRYVARWRRGEPGATAHAIGLAGLAFASAHDAIGTSLFHSWAHLVPLGLVGMLAAVGTSLARRFVAAASELEILTTRLDAAVALRTEQLARTQQSLAQAEKLAVLGRLSGAVAHEINNPAAAVAANLGYVRDALRDGRPPADAAEVIDETLQSVDRIANIVRQLGDAGDLAAHGGAAVTVCLADMVRDAAADARGELRDGVVLSIDIPSDVYVRTQEASLRQVTANLIASAAGAMRAVGLSGRIRIEGARREANVLLRIVDSCPEADAALRTRRFDPFLSARPTSVARDVGLSVSVVLLRVFGGDVSLERADDEGNTVRVDLQAAEPPARRSYAPDSTRTPRARVLLVDDDVLVRIGLRRLLGRQYVIEEAGSVAEALAHVRERGAEIDAILCDLVMPDGGAEKILEELERIAPALARATVLLTGGAVDDQTRALVEANAGRVLRKPVDIDAVRALIERVRLRRVDAPAREG
ncbi:MAG TPA: response regulator [Polyangiaceae bacterium]|jgi:signal transduction histidine kinase/ActR/RegA family two-component response regulator